MVSDIYTRFYAEFLANNEHHFMFTNLYLRFNGLIDNL